MSSITADSKPLKRFLDDKGDGARLVETGQHHADIRLPHDEMAVYDELH